MEENQSDDFRPLDPDTPPVPESGPQPPIMPPAPEPVAPASIPEAPPPKPKPTKFQRFFRRSLLWLIVIALAFLGGIIVIQQVRLGPAEARLAVVEAELERLSPMAEENQIMAAELESATGRLGLLRVLLDVNNAQMALALDNPTSAGAALADTDEHLAAVIPLIEAFDQTLAETLPQRLSLIQSNIEADTDTAIVDIDLLVRDLLKVEEAIFEE